jgi:hypothetical protein
MVFVTAGASDAEIRRFLLGLFRPWLEKPFSARDLQAFIEAELARVGERACPTDPKSRSAGLA